MAVVATRLTLEGSSRTLTGGLGGKFLHCTMRLGQGGDFPPAGDYEILPPISDPIYGMVALMVPARGLGAKDIFKYEKPLLEHKDWAGGGGVPSVCAYEFYVHIKGEDESPSSKGGRQIFVLSDKPVLGHNSIVLNSGFADLLDALQTSGGAMVEVI